MSSIGKPVPDITPEMKPFFDGARQHELWVQRCTGCNDYRFPARELCSACLSRQSTWERVSGRGSVYSFTIMHQVYHPSFAAEVPYAVVIVELEEGPRLTSNLVGVPIDQVRIGLPVEVTFEAYSDEVVLPKFRASVA